MAHASGDMCVKVLSRSIYATDNKLFNVPIVGNPFRSSNLPTKSNSHGSCVLCRIESREFTVYFFIISSSSRHNEACNNSFHSSMKQICIIIYHHLKWFIFSYCNIKRHRSIGLVWLFKQVLK